ERLFRARRHQHPAREPERAIASCGQGLDGACAPQRRRPTDRSAELRGRPTTPATRGGGNCRAKAGRIPRGEEARPAPEESEAQRARSEKLEKDALALASKNDRLVTALTTARSQLVELREQVEEMTKPPTSYAMFLAAHPDRTVDVLSSGR